MRRSFFHRHVIIPCLFLGMTLFLVLTGFAFPFLGPSFSEFTGDVFRHELRENTLTLHYTLSDPKAARIEAPEEPSLGSVGYRAMQEETSYLKKCQKKLSRYLKTDLTDEERLTAEILGWWLEGQLALEPYYYYQEPLGPTLGVQAQLPVLLTEYRFRSRDDIDTYLALLGTLPDYFSQLADFEEEKSAQGLFMNDESLDLVLAQCRKLAKTDDFHLLVTSFTDRLKACDFLTDKEQTAYELQNRKLVFGAFRDAYEALAGRLEALRGSGQSDGGLYHTPKGIAYYELLLKYTIGTSMTSSEIRQLLEEQIASDYETILYALSQNLPLPSSSQATSTPEQILRTLKTKIQKDFPSADDIAWTIKEVPDSLREYMSPAFYMTPAIDTPEENVIYINPAKEMDRTALITTLAHEGYPGHLYQNAFENAGSLDPIRSLIYIGGYTEGWGLYSEFYAYDFLGLAIAQADVLRAYASLNYAICAMLDLEIHTAGWSEKQCADYLSAFGITDAAQIHTLFQNILEEPSNYLKYYIGYLEICKLKERSFALSSETTPKDFHQWFLTTGPAPFFLLEERLHQPGQLRSQKEE